MSLTAGEKLGSYEILSPLGAGGMGEVYRARDSQLGREVAIKVLPEEFTDHPQKLARFEREARLLAALNHPGIATLHGLEKVKGKPFLVMELVEGETLAERIARGPLPVDETLTLAQQIADALEAAHEKGVIHRDLKPANIKVDPEGQVKVLDFGLAKAFADEGPEGELSQSPTLSRDATRAGVILGTAAYMSPEQAKGKTVDKRSDIFSFGIVLYEMLTGKRAFAGEDVSDVLAAIIRAEPDWKGVPSDLDPRIQSLLRRCLRKDRKTRLRDVGDVRNEIEAILAEPDTAVPSKAAKARAPVLAWALAGVLAVALLATLWILWPTAGAPEPPVRFSVNLGAGDGQLFTGVGGTPVLSPDGKTLALVGQMPGGNTQLYIRPLDNLEATPLSGTEGAYLPFFSPDGRWLAFFTAGALKKVSVSGGAALTIAEAPSPRGGTWGPDDTIVSTPTGATGLYRVPASGGTPVELTELSEGEQSHRFPRFLPNGKAVLFMIQAQGGTFDDATIEAVLLDTGERKVLHRGGTYPRYASSGHLLYAREATLFAMPFDAERIEPTGEPTPVIEGVGATGIGEALFSVADDGSLVYVPGVGAAAESKLVWVDRQGVEQPVAETLRAYLDPRLSPDGQRLAVAISDADGYETWLLELGRGTLTRLTFGEGLSMRPLWSPDGERVIFASNREGNWDIFSKPADGSGTAEQLTTGAYRIPTSISSDGKSIVFRQNSDPSGRDIGMVRLEGESEPEMLLQTPFHEDTGMLSPDDRWLAYVSNESGREEIYARPFPGPGGKLQISTEGGTEPMWSRDGRELFYRTGNKMMAIAIATEPELAPGRPTLLFEGRYLSGVSTGNPATGYDVAPDGRFVMIRADEASGPTQIHVVLNWFEELKRLVPTN